MHYGFWGNEYFTAPDTPEVAYPEGFQGNEIPIGTCGPYKYLAPRITHSPSIDRSLLADGKIVAELIHARLSIEVTAEAEGEIHDLIHLDDDDEEKVDGLDDETDPEVMDADEEI